MGSLRGAAAVVGVADAVSPTGELDTYGRPLELQWCEDCSTVDHRPPPPFGPEAWVVALVDLDEGARLMTNIVDCPVDDLLVGLPVEVVWEPLPDGRHLPLFKPKEPSAK